ncbi:MAG: transketolase C-terminal domain-containing protein [Ignavibacteriaceae bacterium]|jgi:pyruvate ferredoxin oxidoreductase alpha subunit
MSNNNQKLFLSGNEAIAYGAKLARPNVIAAYPITPQTVVVEKLSEMVESKELNAEFMLVESEHSALSAMIGASLTGARTFTATSSQGLLFMAECLHYASGGRFPIVMMNANRSVALPWSIYGDQRDSLSLLDSGWIQVYAESAQESLDLVIQAYKIAENLDVLTPFMINLDGFVLTHTYETVLIPSQEDVDAFLPPFNSTYIMDLDNPKNFGFSSTPADNMEFKYQQNQAMLKSKEIIFWAYIEFGNKFGRYYGGLIDSYFTGDADVILITLGSITGTVRTVIDKLRSKGTKAGLLKIRYMRPFPADQIVEAIKNAKAVGVLEKDISFGFEGTVFTNVSSAVAGSGLKLKLINYIGGLGGRTITPGHIEEIFNELFNAVNNKVQSHLKFVNLGVDVDEQ